MYSMYEMEQDRILPDNSSKFIMNFIQKIKCFQQNLMQGMLGNIIPIYSTLLFIAVINHFF